MLQAVTLAVNLTHILSIVAPNYVGVNIDSASLYGGSVGFYQIPIIIIVSLTVMKYFLCDRYSSSSTQFRGFVIPGPGDRALKDQK